MALRIQCVVVGVHIYCAVADGYDSFAFYAFGIAACGRHTDVSAVDTDVTACFYAFGRRVVAAVQIVGVTRVVVVFRASPVAIVESPRGLYLDNAAADGYVAVTLYAFPARTCAGQSDVAAAQCHIAVAAHACRGFCFKVLAVPCAVA